MKKYIKQPLVAPNEESPYYHYKCAKCGKPVKTDKAWFDAYQYHYNCLPKITGHID